ncbi:hypothetical protein P7H17_09540 [Paenibacillus larvae]|nr:hypothetical protein [Paenibacillus larvae]MDT2239643.1 hypothetical protein [Paenibacillus larvae]MDT2263415.1 hypothetical protein [Paenibacillus larvae]MDT2286271.1 hypothetical protein [Paenibacillus larvae]MDT2303907.1 hypothetical protein [Paenibacillus larvae]
MSELQPKTNQQDSASGRTLTGHRTDDKQKRPGDLSWGWLLL